jgi:hypothetical protein
MNDSVDFEDIMQKVKSAMVGAGEFKIGSTAIKSFDNMLIYPTEETIFEHWQTYQGALCYYSYLLCTAETALREAEEALRMASMRQERDIWESAKTRYGISRPTRDDVILIGIIEGREDFMELKQTQKSWDEMVRLLRFYVESWGKKSFALNKMTDTVLMNKHASIGPSSSQKKLIDKLTGRSCEEQPQE